MTPTPSRRAHFIVRSEIRNMSVECERLGGINLSQGICDTEVPPSVRRAAQAAMDEGCNSYTRHDGLAELRNAVARKLWDFNRLRFNPQTEVVVSAGSTGAFYCACLALLNPGDEVVLFEPYYGYHLNTLLAVEAVPTYVTLHPPTWSFTREALEAAMTPRTRALVVNTPANPSGKVFTAEELGWIAEVANRHDLFVLTDEIYEYFLYEGSRHLSPATVDGLAERTVTISGFSKTFGITGWRIGYSACRAEWAETIGYLNDLIYVCAPAPLQRGVAKGIEVLGEDYYLGLRQEYASKRERICEALRRAGLPPHVPQGAYYVLADASALPGKNSKDRAMYLLKKAGIATVPGSAFFHGDAGETLLRFCFAKPNPDLDEACRRLGRL